LLWIVPGSLTFFSSVAGLAAAVRLENRALGPVVAPVVVTSQ
jgi:hypothetical protein